MMLPALFFFFFFFFYFFFLNKSIPPLPPAPPPQPQQPQAQRPWATAWLATEETEGRAHTKARNPNFRLAREGVIKSRNYVESVACNTPTGETVLSFEFSPETGQFSTQRMAGWG